MRKFQKCHPKPRGFTLVELIVALFLSSLLVTALYYTFVKQHKTYTVQEQVVDTQQNARVAVFQMMRELRMAGFGRVAGEYTRGRGYYSRILPAQFVDSEGKTIVFPNVINRNMPRPGVVTIITALYSERKGARVVYQSSRNTITVDQEFFDPEHPTFDLGNRKYVSIDGVEANVITGVSAMTIGGKMRYRLSLSYPLRYGYPADSLVYPIRAVTFDLGGRQESGGNRTPVAENIEAVGYRYLNTLGDAALRDEEIRMIELSVTARTDDKDADFTDRDGYRRREFTTNLQIRNLSLTPQ